MKRNKATYVIQVDIDTAKVRQHKVPYGICPLDRLAVVVESTEEPWVLGSDQLS